VIDQELEALAAIARTAGRRVMELYALHLAGELPIEHKAPGDPVTRADREANALISEALAERFPEASVVAEESAPAGRAEIERLLAAERVFYVDPLDGTREFVDRNGEFAVMIGLAEGGRATLGVVLVPAEGLLLAGRVGVGAFAEDAAGARQPLAVSERERFSEARMIVSRSHRPAITEPLRRRLGIVAEPTPCGSVGVKVARIAQGRADVYVHAGRGMRRWDTCAPEAVLAAAGGRATDLDGAPLDYADADLALRRGWVASNGTLHAGVLSAVGWAEREVRRLGSRR
jgi:3'(2'), 5'-bisphosphate nucleotidase